MESPCPPKSADTLSPKSEKLGQRVHSFLIPEHEWARKKKVVVGRYYRT